MMKTTKATIIIPALNEAESIGLLIAAVPSNYVDEIIVVEGGSTDETENIALEAGATVLNESRRGYGRACHSGLLAAMSDVVIFLDADGADDPRHIPELLAPIIEGRADLVLGSRLAGKMDKGAMPFTQWVGNYLAAGMFRLLYKMPVTDLSPFRAGFREKLLRLDLQEMTYGLPTEMIAKAFRGGLRVVEIPVSYHQRIGGKSKISGTFRGTILAAYHILRIIIKNSRI